MTVALYPAEFVFPGHPDKLADAIADALLEQAWRRERRALVGVEVAVHRENVYLTGRIACGDARDIDLDAVVRDVYRTAGYGEEWGPAADDVRIVSDLCLGPLEDGEAEFRDVADDQAICVGYANDLDAAGNLPIEQWIVHRLARRLHDLRVESPGLGIGPDGKVMIAVREHGDRWNLADFTCSLQQKVGSDAVALHRAVRLAAEDEMRCAADELPGLSSDLPERLVVNGAGNFEVGGPEGDNGLSGKKLVVDAYGPRVPIGGGAWSGKDFYKADRAGALHARRVAKTIVQLGLAREARVILGWHPGDRQARLLRVDVDGGRDLDPDRIGRMFDLGLRRSGGSYPVEGLARIARWGHFHDPRLPWERIDGM